MVDFMSMLTVFKLMLKMLNLVNQVEDEVSSKCYFAFNYFKVVD